MKLSTVATRMPMWYNAGISVYLKSAPGRGKTSVLASAPGIIGHSLGKTNLGVVIISGPLLTPADSIGFLMPKKGTTVTSEGNTIEIMESAYTDPFWFRTDEGKRLSDYDGGVIVVDEADKMDVDIKKIIGEAALSGRLGPHRLPPGWVVWMAGNRQQDRSGSTKELDHLINRRMEIDVTDDIESWNEWADTKAMHPLYKAFVNQNIDIVFSDGVPKTQGPWATPRSVSNVGFYHASMVGGDPDAYLPDDPDTMEEIAGKMGQAAAGQLVSFLKLEREMPKLAEILADPKGTRIPTKPDAAMLVSQNLAHRTDKDNADALVTYMNRLPPEFSTIFNKAIIRRDPRLVVLPILKDWIRNNNTLITQLGRLK